LYNNNNKTDGKEKIVIRHLPEYFQKRLNKNIKEKKFIFFKKK
jgi:hypothetical protein